MTERPLGPTPEEKRFSAAAATYERKRISQIIHDKQKEFRRLTESDYEIISRNIWTMLKRLEKDHHVKKSAVFRKVFPKYLDNPTKRRSDFATPPGRAPSRQVKKKFATYFKFVEKAKECCPDAGDLVYEVFADAQFWRKYQRSADSRHVKLMQRVCLVMDDVARKTDLRKYFRAVRDYGGVFSPAYEAGQEPWLGDSWSEHQVMMEFEFFADERQQWPIELARPIACEAQDGNGDSVAAYPLVDLGTWQIGEVFPVTIEASIPTKEGGNTEVSGVVSGRTLASLRLCIVPTGNELEPTPALRVALTTRLDALTDVSTCAAAAAPKELLSFPWSNIPAISRGTTLISARVTAGSIDCECRATVDADVLPEPFSDYFPVLDSEEHLLNWAGALRFFPLTELVCLDWFGLRLSDSLGKSLRTRLADWVDPVPLAERSVAETESGGEFEPGSLVNAIDAFLCDPENGLDRELETSARTRITLAEQTLAEVRQEREEGWQQVMRRLGKADGRGRARANGQTIDDNEQ